MRPTVGESFMETRITQTSAYRTDFSPPANFDRRDELAQQRLDLLLTLNAETAARKEHPVSEQEKIEAAAMKHPLSDEQAYSYFGLLLGTFPPLAISVRFLLNNGNIHSEDLWIFGVVAVVSLISAMVGYFSGKLVGRIVGELEKLSWLKMFLALPFIGILWGSFAGGAGGVIIFIFGAIFGAIIGGTVGNFALPVFTIFHRWLKKDGRIDRRHFLPLAFGITFIISAFILGY